MFHEQCVEQQIKNPDANRSNIQTQTTTSIGSRISLKCTAPVVP